MAKLWKYSAGEYGNTVTVLERSQGGNLYIRVWDPEARHGEGALRLKSLKHKNREKAIKQAHEVVEQLRKHRDPTRPITLGFVFAAYLNNQSPSKKKKGQKADRRRTELWINFLGRRRDPQEIYRAEWQRFIEQRSKGLIDARGQRQKDPTPVGARTVQADLQWLKIVFNWAVNWFDDNRGSYLMSENPVRGFDVPREKNPERPVASEDDYRALLEAAKDVQMEIRWNGKREKKPSYLPSLLVLANGTGRRISAICQLTTSDIRPTVGPYGSICWPADTDKMEKEWLTPVNKEVGGVTKQLLKEALDEERLLLFPSPCDPEKPISKDLASSWGQKAAATCQSKWKGWHSFRRKWASDRRDQSRLDVARAGGWTDARTMEESYQHVDWRGLVEVVNNA